MRQQRFAWRAGLGCVAFFSAFLVLRPAQAAAGPPDGASRSEQSISRGPVAGTSRYAVNKEAGGPLIDSLNVFQSFYLPFGAEDIQPIVENVRDTAEVCGPRIQTLTMSAEYPPDSGQFRQFTFHGAAVAALEPCGTLTPDPMKLAASPGTVVRIRLFVRRAATDGTVFPANWPYGYVKGNSKNVVGGMATTTVDNHWDGAEELTTRSVVNGVCTAGDAAFTSASAQFKPQDAGQSIRLQCGPGGAEYVTTIARFVNGSAVSLALTPALSRTSAGASIIPKDKTMGGAIFDGQGRIFAFGVHGLLGRQPNQKNKSIACVGDSITGAAGDYRYGTWCALAASWAHVQMNLESVNNNYNTIVYDDLPWLNEGMSGETYANFSLPQAHAVRVSYLHAVKYVFLNLGTNDIAAGEDLATLQFNAIKVWRDVAAQGCRLIAGTIPPRTGSVDNWFTSSGQTAAFPKGDRYRILFNDWLRDGAPIVCATGGAAPFGSSGPDVTRSASYDVKGKLVREASQGRCTHPLAGTLDMADAVESGRNSGSWGFDARELTFTGCSAAAGTSSKVTCSGGGPFPSYVNFDSAVLYGAGKDGTPLAGQVLYKDGATLQWNGAVIQSATDERLILDAVGNPNNIQAFGRYTSDGIHPNARGMVLFAAPVAGVLSGLSW